MVYKNMPLFFFLKSSSRVLSAGLQSLALLAADFLCLTGKFSSLLTKIDMISGLSLKLLMFMHCIAIEKLNSLVRNLWIILLQYILFPWSKP
jgi:hypothetical protein